MPLAGPGRPQLWVQVAARRPHRPPPPPATSARWPGCASRWHRHHSAAWPGLWSCPLPPQWRCSSLEGEGGVEVQEEARTRWSARRELILLPYAHTPHHQHHRSLTLLARLPAPDGDAAAQRWQGPAGRHCLLGAGGGNRRCSGRCGGGGRRGPSPVAARRPALARPANCRRKRLLLLPPSHLWCKARPLCSRQRVRWPPCWARPR